MFQAHSQNIYPFTPPNWDGPLVINSVEENYTIGSDLQEGYQLYFSYALQHTFSSVTDGIDIEIQVNGNEYRTRFFTGVSPSPNWGWDMDLPMVLPEGTHELRIIIDPDNEFSETNENDNEASITVTVSSSPDFEPPAVSAVASAEYFIDTDPGFGNGTAISFTEGMDITNSFTADLSSVSTGFHQLYTRARNADGYWGATQVTSFINLVAESNEILLLEYFVDDDPGFGNAMSVPFTPGEEDIAFNVDLSMENTGFHQLFVRAKSANGSWSMLQKAGFLVERGFGRNADIVGLEYYYVGSEGTSSLFEYEVPNPGKNLELIAPLDISFLEDGQDYTLVVRAIDASGAKSLLTTESFTFNSNFKPEMEDQSFTVNENSASGFDIGQLLASDEDDDPLTFSLGTEGIEEVIMLSSEGFISILDSAFFNFEDTTSIQFRVKVSDSKELDSAMVTIDVLDVNDDPIIANQNFSIEENSPNSTFIGQVEAIDEDGDELTFSITVGNDEDIFAISSDGVLSVADSTLLDFEKTRSILLEVQVSDPVGATTSGNITIDLLDVNDPPTIADQAFDLEENQQAGFEIGQLLADDQDGDNLVYDLIADGIDEVFTLSESGLLSVLNEDILNFEDTTFFEFEVRVSDGLLADSAKITINILDINDFPVVEDQEFTIEENSPNGTIIGEIQATDEDGDALIYDVQGDGDFALDLSETGILSISDSTWFDFESFRSGFIEYDLRIEDGREGFANSLLKINLLDVNDIPVVETAIEDQTFEEGFGTATIDLEEPFATVFVDDDGDELTFTVGSSDESVVTVFEADKILTITEIGVGSATVTVTADDGNGGTATDEFAITVNKVNDPPAIADQAFDLEENQQAGFEIGQLLADDQDGDNLVYDLIADGIDEVFTLSESGLLSVLNEDILNFEDTTFFEFEVRVSDGLLADSAKITINILDINDFPVVEDQEFTIEENSPNGTIIGEIQATDEDGDALIYDVQGDGDFALDLSETGILSISDSTWFDFESFRSGFIEYDLRIEDGREGFANSLLKINLLDVNDIPVVETAIEDQTFEEGFGTATIDLEEPFATVFVDDDGDELTFTVGSSDESVVTVFEADKILTITEIGVGSATVTVTADDGNGGTATDEFAITVNNVNDAPIVANPLPDLIFDEDFGNEVIDLTTVFFDEDGDELSYVVNSSDESVVTVSEADKTLTITEVGTGSSTITVRANDGNEGTAFDEFAVTVNNVNNAPTVSNPVGNQSFEEGFVSATVDLSTTFSDPDGDELSYAVTSSVEAVVTVAAAGNTLTITEIGVGSATITVTADDGNGGAASDEFEVNVDEGNPLTVSKDTSLKYYPNPTQRFVYIDISVKKGTRYTVSTLSGRVILKGTYNTNPIDLVNQPTGVYIMRIGEHSIKITKAD